MALTQKKFFDEPIYFSETAWLEKGAYIRKQQAHYDGEHRTRLERFNDVSGKLKWAVGDWLCEGVDGGIKPKKLKNEARRVTGYQWGTLKNCMVVSRAVESSRRRDVLPYSLHVEVAKYTPEQQEEYLVMAEEMSKRQSRLKPISVRDFRVAIKNMELNKMTLEERVAERQKKPVKPVILKIAVNPQTESYLNDIARVKKLRSAADALWWLAKEYVKEHKEPLLAEVTADKVARAAEQKKVDEERQKQNDEWLAANEEEIKDRDDIPTY